MMMLMRMNALFSLWYLTLSIFDQDIDRRLNRDYTTEIFKFLILSVSYNVINYYILWYK